MHQIIRQYWVSCTLLSAITICLFAPLTMLTPEELDLYNNNTIPSNPEQYQAKKAEIVGKLKTIEKQFAKQNFSDAKLLPVLFLTPLDVYPGCHGNWSPVIEYGLSLEHYPNIEKWLKEHSINNYIISEDLHITVQGNVNLSQKLTTKKLPVKFKMVDGYFDISKNGLTSLEGSPKIVTRDFNCSKNNLHSLFEGPIAVGDFDCSYNQLKNLSYAPKEIKGSFDCSHNEINYFICIVAPFL